MFRKNSNLQKCVKIYGNLKCVCSGTVKNATIYMHDDYQLDGTGIWWWNGLISDFIVICLLCCIAAISCVAY